MRNNIVSIKEAFSCQPVMITITKFAPSSNHESFIKEIKEEVVETATGVKQSVYNCYDWRGNLSSSWVASSMNVFYETVYEIPYSETLTDI